MESKIDFSINNRILITGGGGYLGSKLSEKLVGSNALIFLVDKNFNNQSIGLSQLHNNVKLVHLDLTQKDLVAGVITDINPDYIFHFAALLNRERNFAFYPNLYEVNVGGTFNLLEALRDIPYLGLYYSSSSEVYGIKNPAPFHEEQIPAPASPYSLSKVMAEQLIKTYSDIHQKPFTILRIFNFYGAGMPENFFINQLIATLKSNKQFDMTGGEQIRDFIYIEDLLNAIIGISKSEPCRGEIINICSGKGIKLKEIATEIAQQMGKIHLLKIGVLPYRVNEVWEMVGNSSKLSRFGIDLSNTDLHFNTSNFI